jgi:hypothetical protein
MAFFGNRVSIRPKATALPPACAGGKTLRFFPAGYGLIFRTAGLLFAVEPRSVFLKHGYVREVSRAPFAGDFQ